MYCYICGEGASLKCPKCNRYVCSQHTEHVDYFEYEYTCVNCGGKLNEEIKARKEKEQKEKTCEICKKNFWNKLSKCRICGKRFCKNDGQIFYTSDKYLFWERCKEHLIIQGVYGSHEVVMPVFFSGCKFKGIKLPDPDRTE